MKFWGIAAALAAGSAFFLPLHASAAVQAPLPSAFESPDEVPLPDPDLWQRIRVGFAMDALDSPLVQEHESWYASRPDYIKRFVDRGSRYLHYIVEQVEKRGMPTEIALLPVVESAFTPRAQSRAKASGIWQFIPQTGKHYGLTQDWWRDNRNDIVAATDAALNYLQKLYDQFGNWELALAAYNCGEGCVSRAIAYNQRRGLPTDYLSLTLPPETRNYVPKLIAVKNIVLAPNTYGVELESVPDKPYFTTVHAPARIDVKVAARLANMTEEEFIALNPAHNKPVAVSATGTLVVPVDKADDFRENLESYDKPLVTWTTYMAKRGESLDSIARRHGVSVVQLRAVNDAFKLDRRGRLRAAGPVLVPAKSGKITTRVASINVPTASVGGGMRASSHAQGRYHVVKPGDTLYSIAQRYGTGVDALRSANKLGAHSVIRPGLRLRLP
jgi:membrane-bound lytic murein transglycosylase D